MVNNASGNKTINFLINSTDFCAYLIFLLERTKLKLGKALDMRCYVCCAIFEHTFTSDSRSFKFFPSLGFSCSLLLLTGGGVGGGDGALRFYCRDRRLRSLTTKKR